MIRLDALCLASGACVLASVGCGVNGPAISVVDGDAPELLSWSAAQDCCGEDPHAVHATLTPDQDVVMVGKALGTGGGTRGFVTRWTPPPGADRPRFIDADASVLRASASLSGDSALLQVVATDTALIAVGFRADSPSDNTRGIVVVLDPEDLHPVVELALPPDDANASSVLESAAVDGDRLVFGGSRGFPRDAMEGFKSYGNVVGGTGVVLSVSAGALTASDPDMTALLDVVGARVHAIPEIHSAKSVQSLPDGAVAAIGHDAEERSGMVRVAAAFDTHTWTTYADGVEITDLEVVHHDAGSYAIALVGHGGDEGIDGNVKLVDRDGAPQWSTFFGNPTVADAEIPSGGLAPDSFVFDECWGVAERSDGTVVASCGSGIEGCDAVPDATPGERAKCRDDPRRSWRTYLVGIGPGGDLLWSRADAFVVDTQAFASAAEYLLIDDADRISVVVDHDFGIGLARFSDVSPLP